MAVAVDRRRKRGGFVGVCFLLLCKQSYSVPTWLRRCNNAFSISVLYACSSALCGSGTVSATVRGATGHRVIDFAVRLKRKEKESGGEKC